ncbi:MAG: sigma-70 family RNA polymerase sigma factor [Bacteroidaceae bacterium]|nr:sigma-70 family RNA polymerase sigma factor [Bacteroidaceae bacterium]
MKKISFRDDVLPLKNRLYRLALRITLNPAEAEDAVQDSLIRVWEHRDEWERIESIEAYALTICRNISLDMAGKAGRGNVQLSILNLSTDPQLSTSNSQLLPDESQEQKERIALVRKLMDTLPEVQRSIMELRDIEGKTYQEIADILKLSETQVKVYLHRARTSIRQHAEKIEKYGL